MNKYLCVFLAFAAGLGVALASPASATEGKVNYDGYKVFRITPKSEEHLNVLENLSFAKYGSLAEISFWDDTKRVGHSADVMFPPHLLGQVEMLRSQGFQVEEFIPNVQKLIDEQACDVADDETSNARLSFTAYHRYPAIQRYLTEQAAAHPDDASTMNVGSTFEGQDISGIIISRNPTPTKPIIFVEAGIHAREWISGATANFLINELLNSPDPEIRQWSETYEWHIVPIANPDGFQYSHTHDRLWRKTRTIVPNTTCRGTDPNRNWGFYWAQGGTSDNPCAETFHGAAAFSEPETRTLSEYITNLNGGPNPNRLAFYLDIHSYSQLILFPYGINHTMYDIAYPEKETYLEIGHRAAEALKVRNGTEYTVGTIFETLYTASGSSMDWVKGTYPNTPIAVAYELRDKGDYGFLLPASQIIDTASEFMDSLKSFIKDLDELLNPSPPTTPAAAL